MSEPIAATQGASRGRAASPYEKYQQFVAQSAAANKVEPLSPGTDAARADVLRQAENRAAAAVNALIGQLKQLLVKPAAANGSGAAAESGGAPSASEPPVVAAPGTQGGAGSSRREAPSAPPAQLYQGGAAGPKDAWGDSRNVNKTAVFQHVYDSVKAHWDGGAIPQNVKDLFSDAQTDKYYRGLDLSADPATRAQQKAAIWELATASHETGGSYDPGKLPSYWEAGGSGNRAGQTQFPGMAPDSKGMTYGMFSTESSHPIDVSDPRTAVVADLQKFGADLAGFDGDLQKTLELIGQTDSTSVIPSIQMHGADYLQAFGST
jgi:hypothetical protein